MRDYISLVINGKEFNQDWDDIRVIRSLDNLCSSFEFNTTQEKPFNMADWPIRMGSECKVYVGEKLVVTGFIEDINIEYSAEGGSPSHTVQVAGRDKTADLVDCTRADKPYSISVPTKVLSIIKMLCAPHGVDVIVDSTAAQLANTVIQPFPFDTGAPLLELILKMTKTAGILPIATTDGKLILTATGTSRATTPLQSGVNVKRGGLKQSNKEIFSVYMTKGYSQGTDNKTPSDLLFSSKFTDTSGLCGRYRPLATISEILGDRGTGHTRSYWEAKYRAANSRMYGYSVQGWKQASGELWEPNMLVQVKDDVFALSVEMLINACEYTQTSQGTITGLQVCSPEKYKVAAQLDKIKTGFDSVYSG